MRNKYRMYFVYLVGEVMPVTFWADNKRQARRHAAAYGYRNIEKVL